MAVAKFAARLVKLETRAAGEPYSGNALVVQGGGELVKAGNTLAADGDKRIDSEEKNAGSLAQARLSGMAMLILPECLRQQGWEKKRRAEESARLFLHPAASAGALLFSCQTSTRWQPSANSPLGY